MSLVAGVPVQGPEGSPGLGVAQQYLTFLLAGQSYAVPLTCVLEITPNLELNRMPHMPKGVEGLLDLRGSVLPVINLRVRIGLPVQEYSLFENILILELGGSPTGVLVDRVDSVIGAGPEQVIAASALLAGPEGSWVSGFLRSENRITAILDAQLLAAQGTMRHHAAAYAHEDLDRKLDDSLIELIEMAPRKGEVESARIIPQMEETISHTEDEMAKVVDRVESMLGGADTAFRGIARLKHETQLGRFHGEESTIAEIDKAGQLIQDQIFELLQQLQFQDIARQKLERVLGHIRGMQAVIGQKFRDSGRPKG